MLPQLLRGFLARLSSSVLEHSMNGSTISEEVRRLLIASTHRYRKVREVALKHLDAILTSFAALMCDRQIVFVLLEILTLLRRSCEDVYTDEVSIYDSQSLYADPSRLTQIYHSIRQSTVISPTRWTSVSRLRMTLRLAMRL